MELASPAPWGFACKFSVQHLFHLLSLCRTFHQMAEQMPKDLFRPICQKALRHLLPNNSAFRSFEEVTQNFRANRRTAQKPAKNLFHSASGCPHANRNKSRSMESSLMNPSVLKCKYSYFDQIFILSAAKFCDKSMFNVEVRGSPYQTCLWSWALVGQSGWVQQITHCQK